MDIPEDLSIVKNEKSITIDMNRCPHCSYFSKSQLLMKNHELKHISEIKTFNCATSTVEPFICSRCEFTTPLRRCYMEHVKKIHLENAKNRLINFNLKLYTCITCSFKTFSYFIWLKHRCEKCRNEEEALKKADLRDYSLNRCQYSNKSFLKIEGHIIKRTETKWFQCDQCGYKSKKSDNLKRHYNSQHLADEHVRWFRCEQCDFKTKHKDGVRKHVKHIHESKMEPERQFRCEKCDYSSKTMASLTLHGISRHSEPGDPRWLVCELCGYKTNKGANLKRHRMSKHGEPRKNEDTRWLICEMCGYKTNKGATLKRHINSRHLPDECARWFYCDQCEFKTRHSENVRKHIRNKHDKMR